jgi:hypothetical protein
VRDSDFQMFQRRSQTTRPVFVAVKAICVVGLSVYLLIGLIAAYRAWFQVKSLDTTLIGFGSVFRPNDPRAESIVGIAKGSTFEATVVSYARTPIDVRLELVQGSNVETLLQGTIPDNDWAFFDPRTRQASFKATLTDEVLQHFRAGRAELRATVTSRPQWMRLPPPVVQKQTVEIPQQ